MNLEQKHNVTLDDENFFGKVNNLINYFLDSLMYNLQQDISIEEKISNIDIINEILQNLQRYDYDKVIKICYNPMGAYYINENDLER